MSSITPYYQDDLVTLYHGDCRDVMPTLAYSVLVTDPPYGIAWNRSENKARNSKAHDGIIGDEDTSLRDGVIASLGERPGVVFGSFYAPFPSPLTQVLVWHKPVDSGVVGSTTGYRRDAEAIFLVGTWPQHSCVWSSVIRSTANGMAALVTETSHPHTKPVDLMMYLLDRTPAGIIIDPFCGSGSTLIAAKRMGRPSIGIEVDEQYCEVAAQRLSQGMLSEMFQ